MIITTNGITHLEGTGAELCTDLCIAVKGIVEVIADSCGDSFAKETVELAVKKGFDEAEKKGEPAKDDLIKKAKEIAEEKGQDLAKMLGEMILGKEKNNGKEKE